MTAVSGNVFAAAEFNQYVRDNLNETAVAKATTAGQYFVAVGANSLAARVIGGNSVQTTQTTTSTSYTDLATPGPALTLTTGTLAIVFVSAKITNNTSNATSFMSYQVSGATTVAVTTTRALVSDGMNANSNFRASAASTVPLNAGVNTFTTKYAVGGGTTGSYGDRTIIVIPF
jgi:hypothetical protein